MPEFDEFGPEKILEIYKSDSKQMDLAKKYNVCFQSVSLIKTGKTWTHITGATYKRKHEKPRSTMHMS